MPGEKKLSSVLKWVLLAVFLVSLSLLLLPGILTDSTMELGKVDEIPDIKQTDSRFGFPKKGLEFCAPVVVLDSFVWLAKNGYKDLLLPATKEADAETVSCRKLAELMDTTPGPGTTTDQFLRGIKRYVEECTPYKILSLKYRGWNRHSPEYDDKQPCPSLKWIKEGIRDHRVAWINIGWYKIDPATKVMERQQGHWVTLVGYGVGFDGAADANTLIVRDPSPVLSKDPRKIFITVEALSDGQLTGAHEGLPRDARDYLFIKSMGNGVDSSGNRKGIIDGVIVLDLQPAWIH